MELFHSIDQYVQSVKEQIRFQKARNCVGDEIENHIQEQKEKYINFGCNEQEAEQKAVEQMGDPIAIGVELDRIHRPKMDKIILLLVGFFLIMGLWMQYICYTSLDVGNYSLWKQLAYICIGIGLMLIMYKLDYTIFSKNILYIASLYIAGIIIYNNGLLLYPFQGDVWINDSLKAAYSEIILFAPILSGIVFSCAKWKTKGLFVSIAFLLIIVYLCYTCNVFVAMMQIIICFIAILAAAFHKKLFSLSFLAKKQIIVICLIAILLFCAISIYMMPFLRYRFIHNLSCILMPENDPSGSGYQILMLRDILSHAKLIGTGFTDTNSWVIGINYPLAYFISKCGILPGIAIIISYIIFSVKLIKISINQHGVLASMVSISCTTMLIMETFIFIIGNLGFPIVAPKVLPFFSRGGRTLFADFYLLGILLSIHSTGKYELQTQPKNPSII